MKQCNPLHPKIVAECAYIVQHDMAHRSGINQIMWLWNDSRQIAARVHELDINR
jgi:hypothetical protein